MTKSLGERIKLLRLERNLTLAELSQKTNLSTSYLSQLERGKTIPSLSSLMEIANALGVNVRYFFEEEQRSDLAFVMRRSPPLQESGQPSPYELSLKPSDEPSRLWVWQYSLPRGSSLRIDAEEEGEAFCFVLAGEIVLEIREEEIVLAEGDSTAFAATQSHRLTNEHSDISVVLYAYAAMRPLYKTQRASFALRKEV
ncbi:MAG: helix-turn-helix domain-containing protein [Anaerolineales bacterium]|nr:helix-turn-helix domain-containing protein [Anaerolineales bacterium]MDW8446349.1 helix-turn-helix domain-containing protein [Anaerolineales bacterium]